MRERASASQIYVFSGLKIHLHVHKQSMQWCGTINDSLTDKTLTLRKFYEYASVSRIPYLGKSLSPTISAIARKRRCFGGIANGITNSLLTIPLATECDQFSVSILSVRDTEEKVIRKACTTMKTIPNNCRNQVFQKVTRYKKSRTGVFVKNCTFYQNVRP